jgi:membrane-bound lytic murein transglycosylase D
MHPFLIKKAFLLACSLLFLSLISPVAASAYLQVPDSTFSQTAENEDEQDTLKVKANGETLINDSKQADIILNESVTIGMLDSLSAIPYFQDYYFNTDTSLLNVYNFPIGHIPTYPDSIYKARIEYLDQESPLDLTYNQSVKSFIELYSVRKRALTSKILGLKEIYFPLFEEYLDKYDIPLEMKYLAVVESALNPVAGSRAGAKGLWQFMYYTGKLYGLKVTSLIDERYDPYLATDAACRHMKDLYEMFGDWNLVMAAYNSGAGNVNKAIRRAGGVKNYWAIWPFLPKETRGYVPAFIAVVYVMNYAPEHNLYPLHPGILYNGIDTVVVTEPLAFDQISEYLNLPKEEVAFLNPMFKAGIIPAYNGKTYTLRLPSDQVLNFASNEQAIYDYKSKAGMEKEKLVAEIKQATDKQYHTVRSGESLGLIARKYNVTVNQIKQWNNLKGTMIHPGQKLVIVPSVTYTASTSSSSSSAKPVGNTATQTQPAQEKTTSSPTENASSSATQYHYVKSGENLAIIAGKYGCTVDDIKQWNNLKNNTIYPKQKLRVSGDVAIAKADPPATTTASKPDTDNKPKVVYYTVKRGDTLWDIANQYKGVTVNDLKKWNNLGNSSKLQVGQKLKIEMGG